MAENWIKIEEIEYSQENLSQIYEKIDDSINTQNLETLIEDRVLIQELKNHSIPYKCKWVEKLVQHNSKLHSKHHHYWIEILIPESYKLKYDSMLKNIEIAESQNDSTVIEELENIDSTDNNITYEPYEKASKLLNLISKGLLIIAIFGIIYIIIQSIFNN